MRRNVSDRSRIPPYSILSLFVLISLFSCYPVFKNPIPPPPELKADGQILGTWVRTTKSGSKEQVCFFRRKSSGWIDVVYIYEIDSEVSRDGINAFIFEGYSTFINKQQFLCLRGRKKDYGYIDMEKVREFPFLIVNYETPSNDKLIIKQSSTKKVKELIEKGDLEGEVVQEDRIKGQPFDRVTVTSSSEELVEVISKEGVGALFGKDPNDVLVFSRSKT